MKAADDHVDRRGRVARLLAAGCPGLGHLYAGDRTRGILLLAAFLFLVAVAAGNPERIAREWQDGNVDGLLALATLAALVLATYALSIGDVWAWRARPLRREGVSQWRLAWRAFKKNRLALLGLGLLVVLYAVTLLTPLIAPYEPTIGDDIVRTRFLPPSPEHWMGTDRLGRDVFTRVLYGARISLSIGFIAVGIAVTLGTLIGAVAGYFGRAVDAALMRFVDIVISFPRLILVLTVIAIFDSTSIFVVIAVLGLTLWPSTARLVRGDVLSLREREFVQAAQALGIPSARIIARHVVPNTLGPVIVAATLGIGNTILLEAALSFLGLGVQPPTASWGLMVADGRDHLIEGWWIATFPGLAIVFTVVAFNLVGDGLRDALDPRLRG